MSAIGGIRGVGGIGPAGAAPRVPHAGNGVTDRAGQASFADALRRAIGDVSELQHEARSAITSFLRGEPVEIHEVMAATEEAGIALELLIEIRNKLTEAYRSVIQMQQ